MKEKERLSILLALVSLLQNRGRKHIVLDSRVTWLIAILPGRIPYSNDVLRTSKEIDATK